MTAAQQISSPIPNNERWPRDNVFSWPQKQWRASRSKCENWLRAKYKTMMIILNEWWWWSGSKLNVCSGGGGGEVCCLRHILRRKDQLRRDRLAGSFQLFEYKRIFCFRGSIKSSPKLETREFWLTSLQRLHLCRRRRRCRRHDDHFIISRRKIYTWSNDYKFAPLQSSITSITTFSGVAVAADTKIVTSTVIELENFQYYQRQQQCQAKANSATMALESFQIDDQENCCWFEWRRAEPSWVGPIARSQGIPASG